MEYLNKFLTIFFFGIISFVLLLHNTKVRAISPELKNGGFEEKGAGWSPNSSQIQVLYSSLDFHEGTTSATLTNTSTSSYGLEQTILNIIPSKSYRLSGYIKTSTTPLSKLFLRFAWYSSTDGSGSQLKTDDSPVMMSTSGIWQPLEVTANAPSNAYSAKIRLLLAGGTGSFDDIAFTELPDPTLTVTPTVTPTFNPTDIPIPSGTDTLSSDIFLSEIMSYPATGGHEWIELYNSSQEEVTLTDWFIDDISGQGGSPQLFTVTIPAYDFATIDITTSMFNNAGDDVRLLDTNQNPVDSVTYKESKKGYSWGRNDINSKNVCIEDPSPDEPNSECIPSDTKTSNTPTLKPTPTLKSTQKTIITSTVLGEESEIIQHLKKYAIQPPVKLNEMKPDQALDRTEVDVEQSENNARSTAPFSLLSAGYSMLALVSVVMKIYKTSATL